MEISPTFSLFVSPETAARMRRNGQVVIVGDETTLEALPAGTLFRTDAGVVALKTQYHYTNHNPQPMCILLGSGEYAHFPAREQTRVRPITVFGVTDH